MVEYSDWVSVVWAEARSQGLQNVSFEESQTVTQVAASIWNDRKDEIQNASRTAAQQIAADEVTVS